MNVIETSGLGKRYGRTWALRDCTLDIPAGHLAATRPQPGQSWQAAVFEAILTFGLILMVLNLANGPKLNGPFIPQPSARASESIAVTPRATARAVTMLRMESISVVLILGVLYGLPAYAE